jgi:DNA-directed RNA polymerase subunit RPC12/RpoP
MSYSKGQQFTCPHCGQDSIVKVEAEMDGWTKVGEYFACAMCKEKLEDIGGAPAKSKDSDSGSAGAGADALMDFLGTDKEDVGEVVADDGERRFCRDCGHLMDHPFKVYCLLHKKDVNPMDDCEHFERRKKK